jgi:hypothetical protein
MFMRLWLYNQCCCCCTKLSKTWHYEEKIVRMKKRIDNLQEEIEALRHIILERSIRLQNSKPGAIGLAPKAPGMRKN